MIKYYAIKHLILLKIQNMMDIRKVLFQLVNKCFEKKLSGSGVNNEIKKKKKTEELNIPILRKFEKQKIYSCFKRQYLGC